MYPEAVPFLIGALVGVVIGVALKTWLPEPAQPEAPVMFCRCPLTKVNPEDLEPLL